LSVVEETVSETPRRRVQRLVLVADDSPAVRAGLASFIDDQPGLAVSALAANAASAIELADALRPDVALLDVNMPGGGTRAALGIRAVCPQTRVLALSVRRDEESVIDMLQAGASGYLVKGTRPHKILSGIEQVIHGRAVLSPELGRHVTQRLAIPHESLPVHHSPVRVMTVDDDPSVLEALAELLAGEPGLLLVGAATNVEDAVQLAATTRPDVALIDVRMPDWGGERVAFEVARMAPDTRMIAFTANDEAAQVEAMLRGGASGYIVKGYGSQNLADDIQYCARGHVVLEIGADVLHELVGSPADPPAAWAAAA
jgi:DNA-binding NarL/FixJ family response regulator